MCRRRGAAVMRVVSEQSEQDIRKRKAREALVYPLREFAANLLRVIRGAGRPLELLRQMESCAALLREYSKAHGRQADEQLIHDIFDCEVAENDYRPWIRQNRTENDRQRCEADGTAGIARAEHLIRNASLQIIASTLLDQLTQRRFGTRDLGEGLRLLKDAKEKSRRYYNPKSATTSPGGAKKPSKPRTPRVKPKD